MSGPEFNPMDDIQPTQDEYEAAMLPTHSTEDEAVTEFIRQFHAAHGENPDERCKAAFRAGWTMRENATEGKPE